MITAVKRADPFSRNQLIRDGIGQAIYEGMKEDASIHLFGEGCEVKVHYDAPQIEKDFPERCHTLPISEDGNINFCVGTSLLGVKPIYDVIAGDFLFRAMDSIANTAAKLNFMREQHSTIIIRAEVLMGGPTTGQRVEALFMHIPGISVVMPSTPRDAYGLMRTALKTPGVTLFFEDRMINDEKLMEADRLLARPIPLGVPYCRETPMKASITILTYGLMRQVVEDIPYSLRSNCEVIDLRSLYPVDFELIFKMLKRTGRLLIIEPDIVYGGIGAEIAATIAEEMPRVRIKRVGAPRSAIPASPALQDQILPGEEAIVAAIAELQRDTR